MPHLYIANCTMQDRIANIRIPEVTKAIQLAIPRGRQVKASRDELNTIQIESIVKQLNIYGAQELSQLNTRKNPSASVPYLMSTSGPVSAANIRKMLQHNQAAVKSRGQRFRQEAAIASSAFIEKEAPETMRVLEQTLVEETSGDMAENGVDPLSEGLAVVGSQGSEENISGGKGRRGGGKKPN